MKKIWFMIALGIFTIVGIGLALVNSLEKGQTNQRLEREWNLTETVKKVELYGTQQPVSIKIKTGQRQNRLLIAGWVPAESLQTLKKDSEIRSDTLYLPFSKPGFKLAVSQADKAELELVLELTDQESLEKLLLDTLVGDVTVQVPDNFSAQLQLTSHDAGKVDSDFESDEESSTIIEINTYGKITVKKGRWE